MQPLHDESEIVVRAQAGHADAFEHLVLHYAPLVSAYIGTMLEDPLDAEDVAQEAFLIAHQQLNTLREPEHFAVWLKSISWRTCRNWVRKKKAERRASRHRSNRYALSSGPLDFEGSSAETDLRPVESAWLKRIEQTILRLGKGQQEVLSLFYVRGLPQEQIARFLDIPLGTVKHRLFKGRKALAAEATEFTDQDLAGRRRFVEIVKRLLEGRSSEQPAPQSEGQPVPAGKIIGGHAMRIGFVSDIHGNLDALRAVESDIEHTGVEEVYCLGDIVGFGTRPNACLDRVRERGWKSIAGNHEVALFDSELADAFNLRARKCLFFALGALQQNDRDWIRGLPQTLVETRFQVIHGSPAGSPTYQKYVFTKEDVLEAMEAAQRPWLICGHGHVPMVFRNNGEFARIQEPKWEMDEEVSTFINVGSVGQPRDRDPRACWMLLDLEKKEGSFRRVPYDVESASAQFVEVGLPEFVGERLKTGR